MPYAVDPRADHHNLDPLMHTKAGQLTPYALACGYTTRHEKGEKSVQLWREHGVYHVRFIDWTRPPAERRICENFTTLTEARKVYATYQKCVDI